MKAEQREIWQIRVKKLALSCKTGWEYLPESEEAGSILTDIFLDMELENKKRLERIWEKQEQVFLEIVPQREEKPRRLETALSVRAAENGDGQQLAAGTRAYAVTEQGALIYFRTVLPLKLTAAKLNWIIRRSGLWAWLCCDGEDDFPVSFLPLKDRLLAYPVFRWRFLRAWDGHQDFSFTAEFQEAAEENQALPGSWTVSDGQHVYPAFWQQADGKFMLNGECPEFVTNLAGGVYELKLELSMGDELSGEWLHTLTGGLALREAAQELEPELCLTDDGVCGPGGILPFGRSPEEGACFYLACDRAAGGAGGELKLRFTEGYETEEKLPEPEAKEYRKLYKKYPWLERTIPVEEWRAAETRWEYFNGKAWHPLAGSEAWETGCRPDEPGARDYCFRIPEDMAPCYAGGEEHLFFRLRVCRTMGAYAPYYRRRIPVLEGIRLQAGERRYTGEGLDMPEPCEAAVEKIYFGFDREITSENCWYTGRGSRCFAPEQITGWGKRFGREACWVEIPPQEEELKAFRPNYVELRQEPGGKDEADPLQIPENTLVYLETEKLGVLNGISVTGARYDRAGAPVRDEWAAAENFFSHFGRILTRADMELLIQERYPYYRLADCTFNPGAGELLVKLERISRQPGRSRGEAEADRQPGRGRGEAEADRLSETDRGDRLAEIGGWLEATLWQLGPPWLRQAGVRCILTEREAENGRQGTDQAGQQQL